MAVAVAVGLEPVTLMKKLRAARILVKPLYPGVADAAELGRQRVRDLAFTAFERRIAVSHAQRAPSFRYYCVRLPAQQQGQEPGVAHGGEVPAVFGTGDLCACPAVASNDADRRAWQGVTERWIAFAQRGKPEVAAAPAWPSDSLWRPAVLIFTPTSQQVQLGFMAQRLNTLILGLKFVGRAAPTREERGPCRLQMDALLTSCRSASE